MSGEPRYKHWIDRPPGTWVTCQDCGCVVHDEVVHTRFHSILGSHGWALAVLQTAHIAAHVHDTYTVAERISSKKFDNWSADALAQLLADADPYTES